MNPTPDQPDPAVPVDSVTGMHAPHMAAMNEPTMVTVAGDPADDAAGPGGQDSVQGMHGILMREHAEPRDGFEPVPVWVMTVFGALLMWGGYYVGTMSADFRRDVNDTSEFRFAGLPFDPDNPPPDPDPKTVAELVDIGRAKYQAVCVACHKGEGEGDPAQKVPPLKNSEWVTGPEASPARLVRVVVYGLHQPITVAGQTWEGNQMPPQGVALKDYEIAAALTYVRNSFGHKADPDEAKPSITPATVRAARLKEGKRAQFTMAELKAIPLDHQDPPPAEKK